MPSPRSLIWDSFTKLDANNSQCCECSINIKTKNFSTTGLRSHMRRRHPVKFNIMEKKRILNASDSSENSESLKEKDVLAARSSPSSSEEEFHAIKKFDQVTSNIERLLKQEDFSLADESLAEESPMEDMEGDDDTFNHTDMTKSDSEFGYTDTSFDESLNTNELAGLMSAIEKKKKEIHETMDIKNRNSANEDNNFGNAPINQIIAENSLLKKQATKSHNDISFLQKVNYLLMEMKELKNENEQLKSVHQNEIEMMKKKHKQQLAKMASLIQEFNSE